MTMIAMLLVLWLRTKKKFLSAGILAVSAVMLLSFAPTSFKERISTAVDQFGESETKFADEKQLDESFCLRLASWQVGWDMTMDSPIIGNGLRAIQNTNIATAYLRESACNNSQDYEVRAAHNMYVEVLSDSGFVGLALFLTILLGSIVHCSRIIGRTKDTPELLWAHDLMGMIQVSMVGYAIGSALLSFAYYDGFYVLVCMVIVTGRLVREKLDGVPPRRVINGRGAGKRDRRPAVNGGRRPVRPA